MEYNINFIRNSYIRFARDHKDELVDAFWSCVKEGNLILREEVSQFEDNLAKFTGAKYAIGTGSGTDALFLSCIALGIKGNWDYLLRQVDEGKMTFQEAEQKFEGDEVITVSHTFIASIQCIVHAGARPILVDVGPNELMDVSLIEAAITPRTKAILPVHFHGKVCDMDNIMELAKKYNLYVIEDGCQALGSSYKGKMAGSFGNVGCFSSKAGVTTEEGVKLISRIKEGNRVLTHKNRFRRVTQVFKRKYRGDWYRLVVKGMRSTATWKSRFITATEEHPIYANRGGKKLWISIKNLRLTDKVYIQKSNCEICKRTIPFYWRLCEWCNPAQLPGVAEKIAMSKNKGALMNREISKFPHFYNDILPYAEQLKKEGFKVVPIGVAVPDIIAVKDNKIFAYEIENQIARKRKINKYGEFAEFYDAIRWIEPKRNPAIQKQKNSYFVDSDDEVCVFVESIKKFKKNETTVYNLEVEEDHSYFVGKVAVHNCFSFNTPKLLGGFGDGGGIVTNDRELAEKLYLLRNHWNMAQTSVRMVDFPTPEIVRWAYKSRLDNIQAALLNVKFKYYNQFLSRRQEIAKMYLDGMKDLPIKLPVYHEGDVIQEFIIRIGNSEERQRFKEFMDKKSIELLIRETTPNHKVKYLYLDNFNLPVTENISKDACRLPSYPELENQEVSYIVSSIREFYGK